MRRHTLHTRRSAGGPSAEFKSVEAGAATQVWAATGDDVPGGAHHLEGLGECRARRGCACWAHGERGEVEHDVDSTRHEGAAKQVDARSEGFDGYRLPDTPAG